MDSTSAPLEAHFQLDRDDAKAFELLAKGETGASGGGAQRLIRSLLVLVVMLVVASFVFRSRVAPAPARIAPAPPGMTLASALSLLVPLVIFGAFWFFIIQSNKNQVANRSAFAEPSLVRLDDTGLTNVCGAFSNIIEWRGFTSVVASGEHLALYTGPNQGYIVPRRAFDSDAAWQGFVDFARRSWEGTNPFSRPV